MLIVGATVDAANELVRSIAKERAAIFGWHRLTLSQLAASIATPVLAARGLTPLSRTGTEGIVAGRLSAFQPGAHAADSVATDGRDDCKVGH